MKQRFRIVILPALCALFSINSAGWAQDKPTVSNDLSQKAAEELLKAHEMFASTQTITIYTGTAPASIAEFEKFQPTYPVLRDMGLIEMTPVKVDAPDKDPAKSIDGTQITLTQKGLDESRSWKKVRDNSWNITVADRRLVEVIAVHRDEKTVQGIEFSWTWVPNRTGEALKYSYGAEKAFARVELVEDRWRIVRIRALAN